MTVCLEAHVLITVPIALLLSFLLTMARAPQCAAMAGRSVFSHHRMTAMV